MLTRFMTCLTIATVITACGGGGGGATTDCDTALTVSYVENEFLNELVFTNNNFSASDTTLVYSDGNQGNTYDIDKIIISRTTHPDGNSLALSYSVFATTDPSTDTYTLLFLDEDNNPATGASVGGGSTLGAEGLIVDPNFAASGTAGYWKWNGTSWVAQAKLGTLSSAASYFSGCTLGLAVYAPLYSGLDALYATNVRGLMMLMTLTGGNPNNPTSIIDTTSEFDFMIP